MPLVTITSLKGRTAAEKKQVGDAVHRALVAIGVPETDRFQRFFNMDKEDFLFDARYPDLSEPRSDAFLLIEVLFSVGRSVKVKNKFLETLLKELESLSIKPSDVFVVFKETAWENWSFAAGKILHT